MSWDVMLLRFEGEQPSSEELMDGTAVPVSLGAAEDVRKRISAALPGVDWSDPGWGLYDGNGFSIEFNSNDGPSVDSIMLHVRGGGADAIKALVAVAKPNGWSLVDGSNDEFIDLDNPSTDSWDQFQEFRDRVAGENDPDDDK